MKLFVRSQDKLSLCEVNELHIGDSFAIYSRYDKNDKWDVLGVYDSKERCLEILDEIQKIIDDAPIFVKDKVKFSKEDIERALSLPVRTVFYNDDVQTLKSIVYEMPEK